MPKPKPAPAKRPKPVKAWANSFIDSSDPCPFEEAYIRSALPKRAPEQRAMRVLVVPLREPTEEEVEELALALFDAAPGAPRSWHAAGVVRDVWRSIARAAWKMGARPGGGR